MAALKVLYVSLSPSVLYVRPVVPAIAFHCSCVVADGDVPRLAIVYSCPTIKSPADTGVNTFKPSIVTSLLKYVWLDKLALGPDFGLIITLRVSSPTIVTLSGTRIGKFS